MWEQQRGQKMDQWASCRMGQKYKDKIGRVRKTLHSWWKKKVAHRITQIDDCVKHISDHLASGRAEEDPSASASDGVHLTRPSGDSSAGASDGVHFTRASGVKGPNASGGVQLTGASGVPSANASGGIHPTCTSGLCATHGSSELYSAFDNTLKQKQEMSGFQRPSCEASPAGRRRFHKNTAYARLGV